MILSVAEPRILFYDIESAGVNARRSDLGFVVVFGYKWSDEKEAKVILIDKPGLADFNDKALLVKATKQLEQADLVVGHYASIFDRRFIQGRLLINRLPPIPATKMRDTCIIARSVANFSSNRLKYLAKILGFKHRKLDNNWPVAWFKVMKGDTKTLFELGEYCKGDVLVLEELYHRLRPFDNAHPNLHTVGKGDKNHPDRAKCPKCGYGVRYKGFTHLKTYKYRQFQCVNCGSWGHETKHA